MKKAPAGAGELFFYHALRERTISGTMAMSSRQPTQAERTFHKVESQALANAPTAKEPMIIK